MGPEFDVYQMRGDVLESLEAGINLAVWDVRLRAAPDFPTPHLKLARKLVQTQLTELIIVDFIT